MTYLSKTGQYTSLSRFLDLASEMYFKGEPIISDAQFDELVRVEGYSKVGAPPSHTKDTVEHQFPMYSLQKYYPGEGNPPLRDYNRPKVDTPKLDGAAISLFYHKGMLIQAATRGDGVEGQNITDKLMHYRCNLVPKHLDTQVENLQVTGEILTTKDVKNARNYAAGAMNLNSIDEFLSRELYFVAYGVNDPGLSLQYSTDMAILAGMGFKTVLDEGYCERFPHDGRVIRINSNADFYAAGYTSKHPKGAYAVKERKQGVITTLIGVEWQTGKSGKVTPVAILEPVDVDGATVSRATLNNVGFIKALDLSIGDKVRLVRSGEIIPTIIGKADQG